MRIVAQGFTPDTTLTFPDSDDPRLQMTQGELAVSVAGLATELGWGCFDSSKARGSTHGYPRFTLWRDRVIFAEIKSTTANVRRDQDETQHALAGAGAHVHIWRPVDWITGSIAHELRKR